jgi:argininosuccinate synthase
VVLAAVAGRFAWGRGDGAPPAVEVEFRQGVPVALHGRKQGLPEIVSQLNFHYRTAPWAWDLLIENRFTGIKSRGLYINPAAKLLQLAADTLARTCLNKPTYDRYVQLGQDFGTLMYRGEYFSDQRLLIEAAARTVMARLNGTVTVQLAPTPYVAKIVNTKSIFSKKLATFEKSEYAHSDAAGFIRLNWLSSIGKPFDEASDGGVVETGCAVAPELRGAEPVPGSGLVPAAV